MKMTLPFLLCAGLLTSGAAAADKASRAAYIRANYTKTEHQIPMRDGKRLFTAVYAPNSHSEPLPILLLRTPYSVGPYGSSSYKGTLGPHEAFEREGFIFVFQDVRGRFMSEGDYVHMRPHIPKKKKAQFDESSDTWDTMEWLTKTLKGHNGKVGMWGISYPGFYASMGAIDGHKSLKAVSPQAPIADWFFDDMHHHGAFILPLTFGFFYSVGQPRPEPTMHWPPRFSWPTRDAYRFFKDLGPMSNINKRFYKGKVAFWNHIVEHPNYDAFWQSRNIVPHLKNITAPTLVVGGWYDAEDLYGPLATYKSMKEKNPRADIRLVMGPWSHGGWVRTPGTELGDLHFGFETSTWYQKHVDLPFFVHHLKRGPAPSLPEALMFETGANRWREFEAWPPKKSSERAFYMHAHGRLGSAPAKAAAWDEFVSDPERPVPYSEVNGARMWKGYPGEDQRFASRRPDVLVWESEVLTEDMTVAGSIEADLWVSTDQSSADWVVKVIDVQPGMPAGVTGRARAMDGPGGEHSLIRADVMRGRFRNSYEKPEAFVSGQVTRVKFPLWDVLHTFKKGHRVMIHVQSSWFPLVDRNPQKYVPNIFKALASDYVKATHRVHRAPDHASRVVMRVIP